MKDNNKEFQKMKKLIEKTLFPQRLKKQNYWIACMLNKCNTKLTKIIQKVARNFL